MSITSRLRESTAEHHRAAERHSFQTSLARGSVSRADFVAYLGQMMLIHRAMGSALASAAGELGAFAKDDRADDAAADLRALGEDPTAVEPLPGTERAVQAIRSVSPACLLGMHYVLEGSKNGSRFIAKAIGRGLGLATDGVMRYLDPDGERQRPQWAAFKEAMDARVCPEAEAREIISGAAAMFDAIASISDDLAALSAGAARA